MLPWVCWISVIKDVLYEFHLLFQLQSRSSHRRGNDGYERKSIRWIDRKMEKSTEVAFALLILQPRVQFSQFPRIAF